jgi:hypothetical protein
VSTLMPVMLRGGPSNGCQLTAEVNTESWTIDSVNSTGFTYRDSGHFFHGERIFDWTPATCQPPASARLRRTAWRHAG